MDIATALAEATRRLADSSDSARVDAEVLLMHRLAKGREFLHAWPEAELKPDDRAGFDALIERRAAGEPVAYLTGERGFWTLTLRVTPATLIPRPETELLVERALQLIPPDAPWRVADLGTGSGAVALAIASERPACRIVATDRSAAALAVAADNGARLGIGNVEFRHGSWLEPLAGESFDMIVSNPPYVAERDPHLSRGDLRFEPVAALAAGADGLDAIRAIAAGAPATLAAGGALLLEHGFDQGDAVRGILTAGRFAEATSWRDGAGLERVTGGILNAGHPDTWRRVV